MHKVTFCAAIAALSLPCLAQDFMGISYNVAVSATSRGAVGTAAGEVMTRIDGSEIAGWGTNTPGFRTIGALFYIVQDQDAFTPETFDIKLYPEDISNPGFPDLAAGVTYATGVTGPAGTGNFAIVKITPPDVVGVGDSVPIQGGGDVFVSFVMAASPFWSTDGLSFNVPLGYQPSPTFAVFDTPSLAQGTTPAPVGSPSTSHALSRIGTGAAGYSKRRQILLDVLHNGSGGTSLTITNQTSYVMSNNPPPAPWGPAAGTASMMSGSDPDINGGNPGRLDDLSMVYFRSGLGNNGLALFLMDIAPTFGPEIPIGVTGFTGTGVVCVTPSFAVLGFSLTVMDEASWITLIPAAARAPLSGTKVIQQAAAFDANFNLHMSPCRIQTL